MHSDFSLCGSHAPGSWQWASRVSPSTRHSRSSRASSATSPLTNGRNWPTGCGGPRWGSSAGRWEWPATSRRSALVHVALGALWLIPLAWVFTWSTRRLLVATPNDRRRRARSDRPHPVSALARRACGTGATGAVAWRGVLIRLRTPRTALETFTGAGIGLAIVLVPALTVDDVGAGAVLVGGGVQLAVLFMAGNSFGSDGPATATEMLTGVEPEVLVRAKARSVAIVASPIALLGPLIAAGFTNEWNYLPAGVLVGVGGLLAGAGGAMIQSILVPDRHPRERQPAGRWRLEQGVVRSVRIGVGARCARGGHAAGGPGAVLGGQSAIVGPGDRVRCADARCRCTRVPRRCHRCCSSMERRRARTVRIDHPNSLICAWCRCGGSVSLAGWTTPPPPPSTTPHTTDTGAGTTELLEDELLVEEISIDGMCGVY